MTYARNHVRKTERYDYPSRIEYVLEPHVTGEVLKGVTINISHGGLSIYAFKPLAEGQQIVIRSALPVDHRIATIQWIKQEDDQLYRLGLKFNDGSRGPGEGAAAHA